MARRTQTGLSYSRFINPIERFLNGIEDTDEDEYSNSDNDGNEVMLMDSDDSSSEISSIHASTDSESIDVNYIDEFDDTHFQLHDEYGDILDNIYEEDKQHMDSDKQTGVYYLGIYKYMKTSGKFMLLSSVSNRTYFNHPFHHMISYLSEFSIFRNNASEIEIMQLHIQDEAYNVVLKTHWLRLIQRAWKKRFAAYKNTLKQRTYLKNLYYKETHGRWPPHLMNTDHKLYGLLAPYNQCPP